MKFCASKSAHQTAKKLTDRIFYEPFKLTQQPEIVQIEEYLKNREIEFRYLHYKKNYKILFWINHKENRIEIIDVFDVRQYPLKIKRTQ